MIDLPCEPSALDDEEWAPIFQSILLCGALRICLDSNEAQFLARATPR